MAPAAAERLPPTAPPTPAPSAAPLAVAPTVRVRGLKWRRAALRLKAYVPAPPAPMAAPFLPPTSPPTAAPPAMMAAVRALRPKRERLRLSCADVSSASADARNTRQRKLTKTFLIFKLLPLMSNHLELKRERP